MDGAGVQKYLISWANLFPARCALTIRLKVVIWRAFTHHETYRSLGHCTPSQGRQIFHLDYLRALNKIYVRRRAGKRGTRAITPPAYLYWKRERERVCVGEAASKAPFIASPKNRVHETGSQTLRTASRLLQLANCERNTPCTCVSYLTPAQSIGSDWRVSNAGQLWFWVSAESCVGVSRQHCSPCLLLSSIPARKFNVW
jgi:hypothetical protein